MKRMLFLLFVLLMTLAGVRAQGPARVPAYRGLIERVQPNGDTLHIYLRGDERHHFAMTEDGWKIQEDKKGWLRYTKINRKGLEVISRRKAKDEAKRSKCEKRWLERNGVKGVES